jgi:minor histocompatibility antigen H13
VNKTKRYLSPACTGSVLLLAIINGDTQEYWRWEDGEDDDKKPEPSKDQQDNDKQSSKNIDNQSSDGNTHQSVKLTAAGVKKNQK